MIRLRGDLCSRALVRPSRTSFALLAALCSLAGLTSCAQSNPSSEETADSSSALVRRAPSTAKASTPVQPEDARLKSVRHGVRRGQGRVSTESVIVTLAKTPEHLQGKPLRDAAWKDWLQETLGQGVRVTSARMLNPVYVGAPKAGTQLVVSVANTTEESVRDARAHAEQTKEIERAETDPIWSSNAVPNDPEYGQQWHLPIIQAPQAWDTATGSPNVVVAVIDTGIDQTHPDLANVLWTNPNESPDGSDNDGNGLVDDVHGWNFLGNNADLTDTTGHGTHVAGLIGAQRNNSVGVAGVASGVKIMPLAVGANAPASAVVSAIYYAATHGANIINMSFGGPETFYGARAAIDYAVARGVLLVSSANNWSSEEYNYPAVYQDVVAVAATDPNDRRASLSNYGSWVDIAAPGQAVFSTFPPSSYLAVSGTSQAAPIVAGVAALVKSVHPDWTAEQVRTQLLASADDLNALNPDYVGMLGAGRVNAARAVGPVITTPRPFLAGVTTSEITGNGDQQLSAGDTASVSVSWRFTGNASSATASLTSSDPYVTVTSGTVTLAAPKADRTQTARFTINIAANAPADHIASINASINSAGASVSTPVQLSVAPSYRRLELPFAYHQVLLPHPSGRQLFVADDSPFDGPRHRVYAAFRNADGTFTQETTLSDTTNNARKPAAYVDVNGDVHVAFYQSVQSLEYAAFPGYAKFTAATGQWSTATLTSGSSMWGGIDGGIASSAQSIAITRSPNGELHMAWGKLGSLILAKQVDNTWVEQQTFEYPAGEDVTYPQLDLRFIAVDDHLMLFVHPIPTRVSMAGPPPDFTRKLQVLDYDGTSWSAPVELDGGSEKERAQLPFLYSGEVRRFYQPNDSTTVSLATLSGTVWYPLQTVQDIGATDLHSGFFGLQRSDANFVTFLSHAVEATSGSTRELWDSGVAHLLNGDKRRRAEYPAIFDDAGTLYVFNQERWLHRVHDVWFDFPDKTNLYTQAPLAPAALPTVPVVLDDGDVTNDNRYLHARWSSSHASGIANYRVAWGTAPGLADIMPWTETTLTENTFDLGDQRLLPGQTVYLSVEAHSNAVLSSAVGASDGITMSNLCTAPLWNSQINYQDAGVLVTYQGATYRNLWWNSNTAPGGQNGPWQYVTACVGTPPLAACIRPQWTSGRVYPKGSRVSYNGFEFAAQWASDAIPTGASGNPWKWITNCQ